MRKHLLVFLLLVLSWCSIMAQTAATGDYRSAVATGNWSTAASWQIRDAVGGWTTALVPPTATNNVYIQTGHTITVDAAGFCKDLHINTAGVLNIGTNILSVSGKLRAFTGTAVTVGESTFYSGQVSSSTLTATMITNTTGILRFVGASRTITLTTEWASGSTSNLAFTEFSLDAGAVDTLNVGIKSKKIKISSGTVYAGTSNTMVTGTTATDSFVVKSGAKFVTARSANNAIGSSSTAACALIVIESGATLEFTGAAPKIDATTIVNNGTVVYSSTAAQSLAIAGAAANPTVVNTYNNLVISNASIKTAASDVVVNGTLTVNTGSTLNLSTFLLSGLLTSITNNATIQTANTTVAPVPSGKTWGGLFQYSSTVGFQTIVPGSYSNLSLGNTLAGSSNTYSSAGTINISGTFTLGTSTTANVVTGSTINFNNPTGGQTIPATYYNNLTVSNTSGTNTLAPSGNIYIAGTFNPGTQAFIITGSTINFNNPTGGQTIPQFKYNNLTFSHTSGSQTLVNGGTIYVAGLFTPGTSPTPNVVTGNTFNYNNLTGGQTVTSSYYNNLVISNTSGATTLSSTGIIYVAGTFTPGTLSYTITNSTVNFNNATGGQTIPKFNYFNLTVGNLSGNTVLIQDTIGVAGTFNPGVGTFTITNNTINFNNAAGGQTIPAFTYYNIIFSNNTATSTLASTPAVINVTNSLRTAGAKTLTPGIGTINYASGATFYSNTTADDYLQINSPYWPTVNGPTNVEINSTSLRFQPPLSTDSFSVVNVQLTGNVATITTIRNHTFTPGTVVTIGGLNNSEFGSVFGGTFTISAVTANTFSFNLVSTDVPSTMVIGGVSVSKINRSIPGTGTLKLNGGNINIYAGNKLTMENGSTIFRNLSTSKINVLNGFLSIGSSVNDKVNVTIGNTMSSDNEFAYLATPGKYGTLKIITGIYYLAGSRTIVDLDNSGILRLNDTSATNMVIYGNLIGSGTISGTPLCSLKFFGTNIGNVGVLRFTPGTENLMALYFNRTGAGANLSMSSNLSIAQDLNLIAGTIADAGYVITVGGNISGAGIHTSTGAGKISMTGTAASHQIISTTSLTFGNLDINPGASGTIGGYASFLVTQDLTLNSGILDGANNSIFTVQGNLNGTAVYTGTGKIKMTGSDKTIAGVTVDSIEIASTASVSAIAPFTIVKGLLLNGSLFDDIYVITNAGIISGGGTHTGAGRIKMTGSAKSILGRPSLTNLEVATNASITSGCSAIINGTLFMNGNNVTVDVGNILTFVNNSTIIRTSGNLNLNTGTVQMGTLASDVVNVFINGNLESTNELPGTTTGKIDLTINHGFSYTLKSNSKTVRNLFLNNGHLATLFDTATRAAYNLTVTDIATVSGDFYLDSTTYNYLGSFKVGPSLIIGANGSIKFGNVSSKTLYANGLLVLRSRKTGTASVADVTNGGVNSGNKILGSVSVERYVSNIKNQITDSDPSVKAWRLLAMPTKHDVQTIKQAWQEGGSLNANPNPGYGTQLVSNVSNWAAAGFDTASPSPSLKYYDPATASYIGVASTNAPFEQGKAYMVFIRGSRAKTLLSQSPDSTVLRERGSLNIGDTTVTAGTAGGQFVAVANPYASAINFQTLNKTNISSFLYLYDPRLSTYGAFQTVGPDGVAVPGGGSYVSGNTYIQSSQAFFVKTTTAAGTITFKETSKVNGSSMTSRGDNDNPVSIRANLYKVGANDVSLVDGTMLLFDSSNSNLVNEDDALKFKNFYENLAIQQSSQLLAIESRLLPTINDTVFFQISQMRSANYKLEFVPASMPALGLDAFLEDNYLQVSYPVSLTANSTVDFTINSNPASYASNRFRLVFKPSVTLPVTFTSVKASIKNGDGIIDWSVQNQLNIIGYQIEKSNDGRRFYTIGNTPSLMGLSSDYTFTDVDLASKGLFFYRIKSNESNGSFSYSAVVKISADENEQAISISPNPIADDHTMHIECNSLPAGKSSLILYDYSGKKVAFRTWVRNAAESQLSWKLPMTLPAGQYRLCLVCEGVKRYQSVLLK